MNTHEEIYEFIVRNKGGNKDELAREIIETASPEALAKIVSVFLDMFADMMDSTIAREDHEAELNARLSGAEH